MTDLPASAKIVIIGGGIVGCSAAYHLGKLGWTDVLLLERGKLTSRLDLARRRPRRPAAHQRQHHPAARLFASSSTTGSRRRPGLATGWKRNGGLRLACNAERWTEVKRQATTAHSFGLEMHLLSPKEAQELWPLMQVDDVVGAAFLPTDGQASPSDITQALAKGARMAGVTIREDVAVTGIEVERRPRARASSPARAAIACEKRRASAPASGRASSARMAGVNVPLVSVQHQYLITEPIDGRHRRTCRRCAIPTG